MTFLRNVLHDLVEKRLWPVAVALLIALVAVPVVLGRGSDDGSGATDVAAVPVVPATPAAAATPADAVVKLADDTSGVRVDRKGKVLDPFVQHHQPKPLASTTTTVVTNAVDTANNLVSSLGGGSSSGGSSSATPTPSAGTSTPTTTTKPKADAKDAYTVSLKFGEDGAMKTYKDVARLTPLPSADNPFFVYLGLSDDGKSAVFLVSSDAVPTGDGTCRPSTDDCEQIVMQKGDLEYFELQSGTAGVVQYQLEITGIAKTTAKTAATAARLRARESKAGREYLREVRATEPQRLDGWGFSKKLGLLVEQQPTTEAVAHLPVAVARAAAGEAPEGTATVMTVPAGADG